MFDVIVVVVVVITTFEVEFVTLGIVFVFDVLLDVVSGTVLDVLLDVVSGIGVDVVSDVVLDVVLDIVSVTVLGVVSDVLLDVVTGVVTSVVLLELSAYETERAYCGKIKIAESKRGIKDFVFMLTHHRSLLNKEL